MLLVGVPVSCALHELEWYGTGCAEGCGGCVGWGCGGFVLVGAPATGGPACAGLSVPVDCLVVHCALVGCSGTMCYLHFVHRQMFAKTQQLWMWRMEYLHHEQRPLYFGEWF